MEQEFKHCQSCGMPLARDEQRGGTEKNGDKSKTYCSHCYQNGEFTLPGLTLEQMKDRVKQKLIEFGIPKFLTGFFTRNIHKLERWSK
ncbi:zinc ribbon domain-containing protein [Paenibacillus solisilvae]|uniref:Zinc ribbon domain-containing protein n=1 Tax=Paenibacillus solisilvae TaxID=2486751 RepID=A0ABW0W2N9_9BACL